MKVEKKLTSGEQPGGLRPPHEFFSRRERGDAEGFKLRLNRGCYPRITRIDAEVRCAREGVGLTPLRDPSFLRGQKPDEL